MTNTTKYCAGRLVETGRDFSGTKKAKVDDVCHRTGNGNFVSISILVSENLLPAHLNHGDYLPGNPYPGIPYHVFGEDCAPICRYRRGDAVLGMRYYKFDGTCTPICGYNNKGDAVPGKTESVFGADCVPVLLDVTGDGNVDLKDLYFILTAINDPEKHVDPGSTVATDFTHDGIVNGHDAVEFVRHLRPISGDSVPGPVTPEWFYDYEGYDIVLDPVERLRNLCEQIMNT